MFVIVFLAHKPLTDLEWVGTQDILPINEKGKFLPGIGSSKVS